MSQSLPNFWSFQETAYTSGIIHLPNFTENYSSPNSLDASTSQGFDVSATLFLLDRLYIVCAVGKLPTGVVNAGVTRSPWSINSGKTRDSQKAENDVNTSMFTLDLYDIYTWDMILLSAFPSICDGIFW